MKKAFYVPNRPWIVDDAEVRSDGACVSVIAGLTLEQIQAKFPGAILTTLKAATDAIETMCKTVPRPIDHVDFYYGKTVLKNYGRARNGDSESFKMTEHKNGRITAIYARVGSSFWTFDDVADMSHDDIIERVRRLLSCQQMPVGEVA